MKPTLADCVRMQRSYRQNPLAGGSGLLNHLALVFDQEDGQSVQRAYEVASAIVEAEYQKERQKHVEQKRPSATTQCDACGRPLKSEPDERSRRIYPVSIESLLEHD